MFSFRIIIFTYRWLEDLFQYCGYTFFRKFCTFKNEAVCGPVATTPAPITTPSPDQAKKCNAAECKVGNVVITTPSPDQARKCNAAECKVGNVVITTPSPDQAKKCNAAECTVGNVVITTVSFFLRLYINILKYYTVSPAPTPPAIWR